MGSKLYFLGGELLIDDQHPLYDWQVFPRDVYEFDITTNGPLNKMDAPLNTGKPGSCVFAAAGKIYALGTKMCPNLSYEESTVVSSFVPSIKLFEFFDPITNKWQVLNNPPVDEYIQWTGCNVLERHQQVLLSGWEGSIVVLVYYLQQDKWVRYADPNLDTLQIALSSQEAESHDLVYGLPCRQAPVKTNLDIMCRGKNIRVQDDGFVEMSIPDKPRKELLNTFTHDPYIEWNRRFLRYIGDGHFCYMVSGLPGDPNGPDSYGYLPSDLYTRGIIITLFKELDHDADNIDGNNTTKSEGAQLRHSFQAKILHSQEYAMKSSFYNMAKLVGCFVVSPVSISSCCHILLSLYASTGILG